MTRGSLSLNSGKTSLVNSNIIRLHSVNLPNLVVQVNEKPLESLLDTESEASFIRERVYKELFRREKLYPTEGMRIVSAQGDIDEVKGSFQARIRIQGEELKNPLFVVKGGPASAGYFGN